MKISFRNKAQRMPGLVSRRMPRRMLGRMLGLMVLLLGACDAEPSDDRAPEEAPPADVTPAAPDSPSVGDDGVRAAALPQGCDDLAEHVLRVEPTREALRARFGPPDSIQSHTQPNRHVEGVTDSIFGVYYPDMVVSVHTPGGGSDLATHADVRNNRYLAFPRIGIDAPEDSVVAALGPPTERDSDSLTYDCGMGADQPVRFEVRDGRVERVVVDFYVD